jgi:hypothetical protein
MYMDILRTISGIEVYPVLSLALFVLVFGGVLVWVTRLDRARLDDMAALPLDHFDSAPARHAAVDAGPATGERRAQ